MHGVIKPIPHTPVWHGALSLAFPFTSANITGK